MVIFGGGLVASPCPHLMEQTGSRPGAEGNVAGMRESAENLDSMGRSAFDAVQESEVKMVRGAGFEPATPTVSR